MNAKLRKKLGVGSGELGFIPFSGKKACWESENSGLFTSDFQLFLTFVPKTVSNYDTINDWLRQKCRSV